MLISTYLVSEVFIDYMLIIDPIILKRVLNIILVVIVMIFYKRGEK
jgi:hypothetical protein